MLLKIFLSLFVALVLLLLASSFIFTVTGDTDAAIFSGMGVFVAGIAAYAVSVVDREKRSMRREQERVRRNGAWRGVSA